MDIGVLFGWFGRTIEGDSWFTWWFNYLRGPSTSPKRTPMILELLCGRFWGGLRALGVGLGWLCLQALVGGQLAVRLLGLTADDETSFKSLPREAFAMGAPPPKKERVVLLCPLKPPNKGAAATDEPSLQKPSGSRSLWSGWATPGPPTRRCSSFAG